MDIMNNSLAANSALNRAFSPLLTLLCCAGLVLPSLARAQAFGGLETESSPLWTLLIATFVLIVTAASAALPYSAIRQWRGAWRMAAIAPLVVLLLWLAVITISKILTTGSRALWPLEMFAWAMLNMIYMVSIMTIKRMFAKADEDSASPGL
jgi:predicted ferric reductase